MLHQFICFLASTRIFLDTPIISIDCTPGVGLTCTLVPNFSMRANLVCQSYCVLMWSVPALRADLISPSYCVLIWSVPDIACWFDLSQLLRADLICPSYCVLIWSVPAIACWCDLSQLLRDDLICPSYCVLIWSDPAIYERIFLSFSLFYVYNVVLFSIFYSCSVAFLRKKFEIAMLDCYNVIDF